MWSKVFDYLAFWCVMIPKQENRKEKLNCSVTELTPPYRDSQSRSTKSDCHMLTMLRLYTHRHVTCYLNFSLSHTENVTFFLSFLNISFSHSNTLTEGCNLSTSRFSLPVNKQIIPAEMSETHSNWATVKLLFIHTNKPSRTPAEPS